MNHQPVNEDFPSKVSDEPDFDPENPPIKRGAKLVPAEKVIGRWVSNAAKRANKPNQ